MKALRHSPSIIMAILPTSKPCWADHSESPPPSLPKNFCSLS